MTITFHQANFGTFSSILTSPPLHWYPRMALFEIPLRIPILYVLTLESKGNEEINKFYLFI